MLTGKKIAWILVGLFTAVTFSGAIINAFTSSFEEARTSAADDGRPRVNVTFTSDPTGATVRVGGVNHGRTPTRFSAVAGEPLNYEITADEPYDDYDLYETFRGTVTQTQDVAIDVWIDRTTAAEQAASRDAAAAAAAAREAAERTRRLANTDLIIEAWSWVREDRFQSMRYEGQVTNNRSSTLEFAQVFIEFYTGDGTFISSDWTYLDITSLLPGQRSTFTGYGSWNPAAQRASIYFVDWNRSRLNAVRRADM